MFSLPQPQPVEETISWLEAHAPEMIPCPSQPGGLLITRQACARRHALAQEPPRRLARETLFTYTINMNLRACLHCPVGRRALDRRVA
ncbi:MAG: hypothetical protein KJ621_10045 [Proteobacteria bacterium]|nr:hypothetical protein [Pseudomonadota bacterium]MBU1740959.1 hypothetical protein [Pseudomonadota bacterium]